MGARSLQSISEMDLRRAGRGHPNGATHWIDFMGVRWKVSVSPRRLRFRYPSHAALRRHVFRRDGYTCVRCGAVAWFVPLGYDGRNTLETASLLRNGTRDMLVLDHILTLRAGGRSTVENLQTLCETCNKHKIPEDIAAAARVAG